MKIIGIIAEYNPFHNGHIYHLNKIKEKYPDSLIIAIISGYFTERGEISILTKEDKTSIALNNNIDIVIELPFVYGTQASDIFAYYSIFLLNKLKIDTIIFGSESNNLEFLKEIVAIQNTDSYDLKVKEYLSKGLNYPTAMAKATGYQEYLNNPNDLLGISYLKAISKINPHIQVETIKRTNNYHDLSSNESIISASNIRQKLKDNISLDYYVPKEVIPKIHNISLDTYFSLLKFKILTDKNLSLYLDIEEGLEYRLQKYITISNSLEEFISYIKTKRYTYNKLNRLFIHIFIGLTKEDNNNLQIDYLKILGFSSKGQSYLNNIKKDLGISLNPNKDSLIYQYELKASIIYEQITKINLHDFDRKNIPIQKK